MYWTKNQTHDEGLSLGYSKSVLEKYFNGIFKVNLYFYADSVGIYTYVRKL